MTHHHLQSTSEMRDEMHSRNVQGVPKKTQHLIKWYLSVDIYAISSIGWYCRIGNVILHKYVKFHYRNRRG